MRRLPPLEAIRPALATAGALLVATATSPGSATAALVEAHVGSEAEETGVTIDDRGREHNFLTVRAISEKVTVRELGSAPLRARAGCAQRARRVVTCEHISNFPTLYVNLGRRDDRLSISDPENTFDITQVSAGEGNDRVGAGSSFGVQLDGGRGRDVLGGGPRADLLQGGPGRDRLYGRGGRDSLVGDGTRGRYAIANDLIDGGSGTDTASWEERFRPVYVDLAAGRGGGRGEHDVLRSIENAAGGSGRDRLRGNAGANRLYGSFGLDVLDGRRGNDVLDAGGSTELSANGDETSPDRLRCGPGTDRVDLADREVLGRDCELLSTSGDTPQPYEIIHAQPRRVRGGVAVETTCNTPVCTRRVTLRSRGRVLGRSATRRLEDGYQSWLRVPLKRPLPRERTLVIVVDGTDDNDGPYAYRISWRVRW
jgi:Ca2+-binding RTX toxin-like protein